MVRNRQQEEEYARVLQARLESFELLVSDLTDHLRDLEQDFGMRAQAAIITRSLNLAIVHRDRVRIELEELLA